ncbi:MAG: glycoside hydrolase family 13 protein [Clostridia bacterium]|nr:glycoside hydrolase family 13 protein [Clostridia bacterium]
MKFHSRDTTYKKPFGAAATGEEIQIMFPVEKRRRAKGVFIVLRGVLNRRIALDKLQEDDATIFFGTSFCVDKEGIVYYRFEVETGKGFLFVGRDATGQAVVGDWLPEWQLTVFDNHYTTPQWLKGGLIYHIFIDRFARIEDGKKPSFGYLKSWEEDVEIHKDDGSYAADDFFGGNIKGILSKLDYLESLGVNAIYLSPVFESSSNHRYDTGDYLKIDKLFGDEEEFARLISDCKSRGIGIILDGVFNHTGADSVYFNKFGHYPSLGAYQSEKSPYYHWYTFFDNLDYACWWGVKSVPTVRRDALDFQDFIAGYDGVIEKWTSLGVMGWRLDVVDELSSAFVKKIRSAIKRHGSERVIIGEVWEDASTKVSYGESREYLFGKELDGVMNYPFRTAILDYVKSANAEAFVTIVNAIIENYPKPTLDCCMTLIGTHDTVRVINELAEGVVPHKKSERKAHRLSPNAYAKAKKRLMLAACLQYFLPGVPSLYYGDETALQGYEDPMNRRPYPWGAEDAETLDFYRKLGGIRKTNRPLFSMTATITAENGVVTIARGNLALIANASGAPVMIEKVFDLLTGDFLMQVPACGAIIISNP